MTQDPNQPHRQQPPRKSKDNCYESWKNKTPFIYGKEMGQDYYRSQLIDSPQLHEYGSTNYGIIKYASIPVLDDSNGDYMSVVLYFNEDKLLEVKSLVLMTDDDEYCAH
eukprot:692916_1